MSRTKLIKNFKKEPHIYILYLPGFLRTYIYYNKLKLLDLWSYHQEHETRWLSARGPEHSIFTAATWISSCSFCSNKSALAVIRWTVTGSTCNTCNTGHMGCTVGRLAHTGAAGGKLWAWACTCDNVHTAGTAGILPLERTSGIVRTSSAVGCTAGGSG